MTRVKHRQFAFEFFTILLSLNTRFIDELTDRLYNTSRIKAVWWFSKCDNTVSPVIWHYYIYLFTL